MIFLTLIAVPGYAEVLYFSDQNTGVISERAADGTITPFFNMGAGSNPTGIVFDSAGNLYVNSYSNKLIEKITPGGVGTVFASGLAAAPEGLVIDSSGNLFASYSDGHSVTGVYKITPSGTVSTFATGFANPSYMGGIDSSNNLYLPDWGGALLYKIAPDGTKTQIGTSIYNGSGTERPYSTTVDASGNIYVGELTGKVIKITAGGTVSTLTSNVGFAIGSETIDSQGNLIVANTGIKQVTSGGTVTTLFSTSDSIGGLAYGPASTPEPATWSMFAGALAAGCLLKRFRRTV